MDEVFSINFEGYKTETDYISISKVRLWPGILYATKWIFQKGIPGHNLIQSGLGLMIISNLAISVEGFISDMIVQQLDNNEFEKPKSLVQMEKNGKWHEKLKLYNESFEKPLNTYDEFESIENLFILRDNFLHGLSHSEMTKRNLETGISTKVESTNKRYRKARSFFVEKGFLNETDTSSNIEILWRLEIANFLFWGVQKFLMKIIGDNNSPKFIGIAGELKTVFGV